MTCRRGPGQIESLVGQLPSVRRDSGCPDPRTPNRGRDSEENTFRNQQNPVFLPVTEGPEAAAKS